MKALFCIIFCLAHSSPAAVECSGNRDCQCSDASYGSCTEGASGEKFHVGDLEDCIFQCDVS